MAAGLRRLPIVCRYAAILLATAYFSLFLVSGVATPAWATDFNVNSDATLRSAITSATSGDRIIFTGNITLAADLPAVQTNLTIVGNGNSLSGNNQFRGLFIGAFSGATQVPVTVAVQDLTIANTQAKGGTGGQKGGGGAGLGGAIFVANQATLTVSNVNLTNNSAVGGNGGIASSGFGGGGGMGGNGGTTIGGGGGLGSGATGGNNGSSGQGGIATGASSGGAAGTPGATGAGAAGGGGGGNNSGSFTNGAAGGGGVGGGVGLNGSAPAIDGGAGGFGGGGGSSGSSGTGGAGGFGGGGGSGIRGGAGGFGGGGASGAGGGAGQGGFGGGNGVTTGGAGGGGGAGMGGGIFVQQGGNLTLGGALTINGNSVTAGSGTTGGGNGSAFGAGLFLQGNGTIAFTPGAGQTQTVSNVIADQTGSGGTGGNAGSYGLVMNGAGALILGGANAYSGATTINAGTLALTGSGSIASSSGVDLAAAGATFDVSGSGSTTIKDLSGVAGTTVALGTSLLSVGTSLNTAFAGAITGTTGTFAKLGSGTLTLSGTSSYTGPTLVNVGTLQAGAANAFSASSDYQISSGATLALNNFDNTIGQLNSFGTVTLGTGTLTVSNGGFFAGNITGTGGLTVSSGTMQLSTTAFGYTGATTVGGGTLQLLNSASIANSSGVNLTGSGAKFDISGTTSGATINDLSGVAGTTVALGSNTLTTGTANSTTFGGTIGGAGGLTKTGAGTLILTGSNTYTGATTVAAGRLAVNGSLTSPVTVGAGGNLGGTGTITGNVANSGIISPGNSIGTLNVTGTYTQNAGSFYQVEVNSVGQSDLINVTGNAVLGGGTVSVLAASGSYARNTTYTILKATTGVAGTYAGVTSNLAFLTPTLSYDANDVFLTLLSTGSSFVNGAQTPNQKAVGTALDLASPTATGDFATVLNLLSGLDTSQGPKALNAISGQGYSGFSTVAVQTAQMFMTNFEQQAGGATGSGGHIALAQACDVACDATQPARWGAWGSGVGSFGTVAGDGINSFGTTYNLAGFAGGLDYRFDSRFLAGITAGYSNATLYNQTLPGQGNSSTVQMGLYGKFTEGQIYVDGLAGYAHADNRMTRPIIFPGLLRTAYGQTEANQFFGQLETGYRVELGGLAAAFLTPFARLQGTTNTQNAFSESGASSLDLNVAQQTTNSLRSVFGAQLGGGIDAGWHDNLNLVFRVGWSHEFADTARPVGASFVGAPAFAFTTLGATAPRDGAVVGFTASTAVAAATSLYLRYDGDIEGGNTSNVLSAGLRMTW